MTYAISDIHGRFDAFLALLERIHFKDTDELYILGDAIDRGPEPIKCLQYIMERPNMHMLLGNHELMMLNSILFLSKANKRVWTSQGGYITEDQYKQLSENEQNDILNYIANLPLNFEVTVNDQNYILCHAAPLCKYYGTSFEDTNLWWSYSDETEFVVWNRYEPKPVKDKTIILGHTPTINLQRLKKAEIFKFNDNVINIDCGAAYPEHGGRLCCFCLDTQETVYQDV